MLKYIFKKCSVLLTSLLLTAAMTAGNVAYTAISPSYDANAVKHFGLITADAATTSTVSTTSDAAWPNAPEISSGSAILIDADTGAILYDKNSHEISYPASTTKILTGLLAIENCSLSDTLTFSKEAANSVTWEDAQLGAKAGEEMTVEQVLYGMLLYSANEFAYALGEQVAGSISAFADMMNERAKELGALNTHFTNASGLHDINHYTTAYDMAMIAKGCYNNATFVNIDSTSTSYTIPATNKTSTARTFKHRHEMLKGRTYEYEYCKGGKTGFTDEAGCTLVTFAEKDDMRLICVVFKSESTTRFIDTRSLFDWGFANFKTVTTSTGAISSILSSDSFYDSPVFNSYDLNLNLNSSTLTLPKNMTVGDVDIDIDDNYETTNTNGVYTAQLKYVSGDNVVGTATLRISTPENLAASTNVPLLITSSSKASPKKCLVINLWAFIMTVILLFILAYLVSTIRAASRRRKRRGKRRKLRF